MSETIRVSRIVTYLGLDIGIAHRKEAPILHLGYRDSIRRDFESTKSCDLPTVTRRTHGWGARRTRFAIGSLSTLKVISNLVTPFRRATGVRSLLTG